VSKIESLVCVIVHSDQDANVTNIDFALSRQACWVAPSVRIGESGTCVAWVERMVADDAPPRIFCFRSHRCAVSQSPDAVGEIIYPPVLICRRALHVPGLGITTAMEVHCV